MESFDDDGDPNHRQRLWGAAVFIAILVIVLPLLLDGAGSESQFRRVEKLREEPPSIVDAKGNRTVEIIPEMRSVALDSGAGADSGTDARSDTLDRLTVDIKVGEEDPPDYMKAEKQVRETFQRNRAAAPLTAWVVQAGSFSEEGNALDVRDRLRSAGFASFIRNRNNDDELYQVLVGPMISERSANEAREEVFELLQSEAVVLSYP